MIVSLEVFYNLTAILVIVSLVLVATSVVGQLVILVAKVRAINSTKRLKKNLEGSLETLKKHLEEDPHEHFETHAHIVGETLHKGDLVVFKDGEAVRANRDEFIVPRDSAIDNSPRVKKLIVNKRPARKVVRKVAKRNK